MEKKLVSIAEWICKPIGSIQILIQFGPFYQFAWYGA